MYNYGTYYVDMFFDAINIVRITTLCLPFSSVVVVLCGGNIDTTVLGRCLERGLAADGRLARFTVKLPDKPGSVASLTKFLYEQNARFVS